MNYPFDDELMRFDITTNQYVLTEKALLRRGIDLRSRLAQRKAVTPEDVINGLLTTTSDMIYAYIHDCNVDNARQDYMIAKIPSMRQIIYKAMLYQASYILTVGNLSLSADREKRAMAIDPTAIKILNTTIPELGVPITFAGVL